MFSRVYWNQPVCPSMCHSLYPSVYEILVMLCGKLLQFHCNTFENFSQILDVVSVAISGQLSLMG